MLAVKGDCEALLSFIAHQITFTDTTDCVLRAHPPGALLHRCPPGAQVVTGAT